MGTSVILRGMQQDEYDAYLDEQIREYVESLAGTVGLDAARTKARKDRERFLPDGLATERHRLLVAENSAGDVVGYVWLGLEEPQTKSTETAWLYDIRVEPEYRRAGYGTAILAAVEEMARAAGAHRLGLNVFGQNAAAINLYQRNGYEVMTQQLGKRLD